MDNEIFSFVSVWPRYRPNILINSSGICKPVLGLRPQSRMLVGKIFSIVLNIWNKVCPKRIIIFENLSYKTKAGKELHSFDYFYNFVYTLSKIGSQSKQFYVFVVKKAMQTKLLNIILLQNYWKSDVVGTIFLTVLKLLWDPKKKFFN